MTAGAERRLALRARQLASARPDDGEGLPDPELLAGLGQSDR